MNELEEPVISGYCEHCDAPNPTYQFKVYYWDHEDVIYQFCNERCKSEYLSAKN